MEELLEEFSLLRTTTVDRCTNNLSINHLSPGNSLSPQTITIRLVLVVFYNVDSAVLFAFVRFSIILPLVSLKNHL